MRSVNLLPEQMRPARRSGQRSGSAYGVLVVLAAVLVLVAGYVVTANQVNDRKAELATARHETEAAEAAVAKLGPVGRFLSIKETREQTVKQLAEARFDQERLVRELARVLPANVFLTSARFAVSAAAASTAGGGSARAVATAAASQTGPTLELAGCAPDQPAVAATLVRLRKLYRSADVTLTESAESGKGAASPAPGASTSGGGLKSCGRYAFNAKVSFGEAPATAKPKKVPASLGGGA